MSVPLRLLYGPGPAMIDARTCAAMAQPVLGIRDPVFLNMVGDIRAGLRHLFGTANPATFPVPAGGSGAMEAAIANILEPGQTLAVFAAGHFADRICAIAARHGARVVRTEKPWGQVFEQDEAEKFLDREKADAVAFVQAETSTGAYQRGDAITNAARKRDLLVIADTVTSLGAMPVELDATGIDVAFSCSQKGLACPAGLSPISLSPRAWERIQNRRTEPAVWYLDLKLLGKYFDPPHVYHHTPAPPLYYAMHQQLASIAEEGRENRWERHRKAGEQLWQGLEELGFKMLVEDPRDRIWHMTAAIPPDGVDEAKLRQQLFEGYNIEVGAALGQLAGKIVRIGTMGPLATSQAVDDLLSAIRECIVGR